MGYLSLLLGVQLPWGEAGGLTRGGEVHGDSNQNQTPQCCLPAPGTGRSRRNDPGERLAWASREDSGLVLVFCGRLEDAFRWQSC